MTEKDWQNLALRLCGMVRDKTTGWRENFTPREVRTLRQAWNENMDEGDYSYWHEWQD